MICTHMLVSSLSKFQPTKDPQGLPLCRPAAEIDVPSCSLHSSWSASKASRWTQNPWSCPSNVRHWLYHNMPPGMFNMLVHIYIFVKFLCVCAHRSTKCQWNNQPVKILMADIWLHIYIYTCISVCVCVCACFVYIYIYRYINTEISVCLCVGIYIHIITYYILYVYPNRMLF